jgi:putative addiction module component (TIGR02574 family)
MSQSSQELLEEVLALPTAERAAIVERLLDSLAPGEEEEDPTLGQELDRRMVEMDRDPSASVPWSVVKGLRPE